ncbi:prepilin-type N-terminal cleavage/methylation domain-containing protein [Nocardioides sp. YIM 152588]|uniref:PulJ/GspJ family protein n=1 Tax=Nocardioides sp. YIM 152588 TaxID=3158259 RepID=UPI0032E4ADB4
MRLNSMPVARAAGRGGDDGFTLMELILAIAILGVIVVPLTGIVLQHLKVTRDTEARLNETTDQQFVSAYWQQDVGSLGLRDFTPASAGDPVPTRPSVWTSGAGPADVPSACGSGLSGDLVVGFAWNDYPVGVADPLDAWVPAVAAAAYVTDTVDGGLRLSRVRCGGGAAQRNVLARHLAAVPTVACTDAAGASADCAASTPPRTVAITLQIRDAANEGAGYTATVIAERRQR